MAACRVHGISRRVGYTQGAALSGRTSHPLLAGKGAEAQGSENSSKSARNLNSQGGSRASTLPAVLTAELLRDVHPQALDLLGQGQASPA